MATKASFLMRNRNPDVLNSIANLSNDEVFTPPDFANRMLDTVAESWASSNDGANIWANSTLKFLDPFTKSGVFLREIVSRLTKGLESEIPDLQTRVDHILTDQIYGVATTTLTSLVARRSVYCSKAANGKHSITQKFKDKTGNIWFERLNHAWAGGQRGVLTADAAGQSITKKLGGKCKFCGASQDEYERSEDLETHAYGFIHNDDPNAWLTEIFGEEMQFDVIIGNPPYQLGTGGGTQTKQAKPIYHLFVRQAKALSPRMLCLVIPSRWFSGGMGLDQFRSEMIHDSNIKTLVDFPDSRDVFGDMGPAGGVQYFLKDSQYDGPCEFVATKNGTPVSRVSRFLNEFSTVIRDNSAIDIVNQIGTHSEASFSKFVSPVSPFGFSTAARGLIDSGGIADPIILRSVAGREWVPRSKVLKNLDAVDMWKVLVSATASEHAGQPDKSGTRRILSRVEVLEPGTAMTHSYLMVGPFKTELEAKNAVSYLKTRFVRFLASLVQITQHISRSTFAFVPSQDFAKSWTDEELYIKYNLNAQQIALIESTIRPLELDND